MSGIAILFLISFQSLAIQVTGRLAVQGGERISLERFTAKAIRKVKNIIPVTSTASPLPVKLTEIDTKLWLGNSKKVTKKSFKRVTEGRPWMEDGRSTGLTVGDNGGRVKSRGGGDKKGRKEGQMAWKEVMEESPCLQPKRHHVPTYYTALLDCFTSDWPRVPFYSKLSNSRVKSKGGEREANKIGEVTEAVAVARDYSGRVLLAARLPSAAAGDEQKKRRPPGGRLYFTGLLKGMTSEWPPMPTNPPRPPGGSTGSDLAAQESATRKRLCFGPTEEFDSRRRAGTKTPERTCETKTNTST